MKGQEITPWSIYGSLNSPLEQSRQVRNSVVVPRKPALPTIKPAAQGMRQYAQNAKSIPLLTNLSRPKVEAVRVESQESLFTVKQEDRDEKFKEYAGMVE
jgi:hypothetical protein